MDRASSRMQYGFNPRPPGGGRQQVCAVRRDSAVSIHAPPEEGDADSAESVPADGFQSTPPRRRATSPSGLRSARSSFNPRPPGGGRPQRQRMWTRSVSIHAPPEEGDPLRRGRRPPAGFNPRPPGGGRRGRRAAHTGACAFQSTPPRRRATARLACHSRLRVSIHAPPEEGDRCRRSTGCQACFNPRPPGGGRPGRLGIVADMHVSIHAPPEEGDVIAASGAPAEMLFQSTPPRRRATTRLVHRGVAMFQSTPPRRRATGQALIVTHENSFNPRPPGGGRRWTKRDTVVTFQSTPPRRRATTARFPQPLAEFQSTPPRRRATAMPSRASIVSIHAPPEEGDLSYTPRLRSTVSIHAPPEEGDLLAASRAVPCFNPRPPGGGRPGSGCYSPRAMFQSTPPRRRATRRRASPDERFNPRPPGGGRPPLRA